MATGDIMLESAGLRRVGLLAGAGRLPFLFASAARERGIQVTCVGIEGNADPRLADAVDRFAWNGVARLGSLIGKFRRAGVECVVMAGKIRKGIMFERWRWVRNIPDRRFLQVFFSTRRRDNRDDSLLMALVEEFGKDGIRIASALDICPELLAEGGCLTGRPPTAGEIQDVAFGWDLAKQMGGLDIGQSVVVRDRAVLAVEAIEGTDLAIERAGRLCPTGGFSVIKVAKPKQDMRFDVPAVGINTIETMKKAGGTCLAIESERTILIDREQTIALANRHGIAIVALNSEQVAAPDGPIISSERRDWRSPA